MSRQRRGGARQSSRGRARPRSRTTGRCWARRFGSCTCSVSAASTQAARGHPVGLGRWLCGVRHVAGPRGGGAGVGREERGLPVNRAEGRLRRSLDVQRRQLGGTGRRHSNPQEKHGVRETRVFPVKRPGLGQALGRPLLPSGLSSAQAFC